MRFIVIQVLEETRTLGGMQVALQSKIKHLDNKSVSQPIVLIIMVLKKLAKEQTRFDYVPEICRRRNAGFKQKRLDRLYCRACRNTHREAHRDINFRAMHQEHRWDVNVEKSIAAHAASA